MEVGWCASPGWWKKDGTPDSDAYPHAFPRGSSDLVLGRRPTSRAREELLLFRVLMVLMLSLLQNQPGLDDTDVGTQAS